MPLNDYTCRHCGTTSEILTRSAEDVPRCKSCGGTDLVRLLSAHNVGGAARTGGPAPGGCCGAPGSCGSPGSCCGG